MLSQSFMPVKTMNLISIENAAKTLKDEPLFEHVSLGIDEGAKIGFLGKNGSGKSTFLRLITGTIEPDSGTISRNRELRMSMLEQVPPYSPETSVREYLFEGKGAKISLFNRYRRFFDTYEHAAAHSAAMEQKLQLLTEEMDHEEAWQLENDYRSFLTELGIDDISQPMGVLSGGMRKKTALARALASRPNLLILDEPTNHLDIETIERLEQYLKKTANLALIMVTHDRYILNAVCTAIFELDNQRIFSYTGNYSTYLEQREQRISDLQKKQQRVDAVLKREMEWLKQGAKARTSKDRGRKARIQDLMDTQSRQEATLQEETVEFTSTHRRLGKKVLELRGVSKTYDGIQVIRPFHYSFKRGERIGVIGPNGSGKTTFLELISGRIPPDDPGENSEPAPPLSIEIGINTVISHFDQHSSPLTAGSGKDSRNNNGEDGGMREDSGSGSGKTAGTASRSRTVLEFIENIAERIHLGSTQMSAAQFLEQFAFPPSMHRQTLDRLSGGEKRRLYLISILIRSPNFLILDEPTNDLDIDTIRRLEDYLMQFSGCLLIVSHDRAFLDRTTDYLFVFGDPADPETRGTIRGFTGTYSNFRNSADSAAAAYNSAAADREKQQDSRESSGTGKTQTSITGDKKKERARERQKTKLTYKEQQEYRQVMQDIEKVEQEIEQLEASFSDPQADPRDLGERTERYHEAQRLLEKMMERWEYLAQFADL